MSESQTELLWAKGKAIQAAAEEARIMHQLAERIRAGEFSDLIVASKTPGNIIPLSSFVPITQFLPGIIARFCDERSTLMIRQANELLSSPPAAGSGNDENSDTVPPAADGPTTVIDPNWKAEADDRQNAER